MGDEPPKGAQTTAAQLTPQFRAFVLEKLFPAWSVTSVATVSWLKLALDGQPVHPLEGQDRRCYEGASAFIGRS